MLIDFFYALRDGGLKTSITEYLALLEGLEAHVAALSIDSFYVLARTCLVKDETHFDRFDRVFAAYFKGIEQVGTEGVAIPDEWLEKLAELDLTDDQKAQIEALGGWDKLMETLEKRLAEQDERHEGGNKWIGTAGRSPFGAYGYNPEGIRIGQDTGRHRRAVKVWEQREYADLADDRELGTRNIQIALRRLRRFAREGAAEELDLDDTIASTARRGGQLDLVYHASRRNALKLLILFDVGGSMDDHVAACEQLFTAARSEFQHLRYYYFHNFIYEAVWDDNKRRRQESLSTAELCRTFGSDYRVLFVGDATMSPYEIAYPGGSVEHWNDEAGATWLTRMREAFPRSVWLNPVPDERRDFTPSIEMTRRLMDDRMYPLTPAGLTEAISALSRPALPSGAGQ